MTKQEVDKKTVEEYSSLESRQAQLNNVTFTLIIILTLTVFGMFFVVDYLSELLVQIQASIELRVGFAVLILVFILYLIEKQREQSQMIRKMIIELEKNATSLSGQVNHLEFVNHAAAMLADLENSTAIQEFFEQMINHMEAQNGAILICTPEAGCKPIAVSSLNDTNALVIDEISTFVATTGKSLLYSNEDGNEQLDLPTKTAIAQPLRIKGRLYGIVALWDRTQDSLFSNDDLVILDIIARQVESGIHNQQLIEQQQSLFKNTVTILAQAVDSREAYRSEHSRSVATLSVQIAKAMGLSEERVSDLEIAAFLHDVGFLMVSAKILGKTSRLTTEERQIINMHPEYSYQMLVKLGFPPQITEVIRCHHEWFNGAGYPRALKKENIPLESRIIMVADVYDALTSHRPHRQSFTTEEAIVDITEAAGTQFDPKVVSAFEDIKRPRVYTV